LSEGGDLIVHEGDEGGDDEGGAWACEGGHLVAHAFAAARWHEHERVFTIDDGVDGLFLESPEFLEPEYPVQNVLGCLVLK
jgi:hypothetical protein